MDAGDTDPWSSDDVPVGHGLGDIVWETPSVRDAAAGIVAETVTDTAPPPSRRLVVPLVSIAAVGIAVLAALAWPDRSEPETSAPASSTASASTALDTLPPATTSAASTTNAGLATDASPPRRIVTELHPGDVPRVLADDELTTEVLSVNDEGELVTLSLPSGEVTERVDLELSRASRFELDFNSLVVSPDAALYASDDGVIVVPSGGPPLTIDPDDFGDGSDVSGAIPFGWTSDVTGAIVFVVITFDELGRQSDWLVNTGGEITPAPAQRSGSFARPIFSLGTRLIDDAGGAYRVDPNGDSIRISNGEILAVSETRVLLRECNASRVCNAVLRDDAGEEVRVVGLPSSFRPSFLAGSLSPDGTAITYADTDFTGERTVVDLDSGETLLFTEQGPELPPPTWSADSGGIFTFGSDDGLRFLDRASGEEFSFATELGQIRAIATR